MKKLLIITPHLSTGGAPQVTLNKIELLKDEYEIKCIEYRFLAAIFVVQRNKIIKLLGENFHSLGEDKEKDLFNIIDEFQPDIISMEEFPEFFMDDEITKRLYDENRPYSIFETTHDSSFPASQKRFYPDKFVFVSAYNAFRYSMYDIPYDIVEYPVDIKYKDTTKYREKFGFDDEYKHVINVGLFTPRKNQSYVFDIARKLENYKIKFHFIGNQADNFKFYWAPLMINKPSNCVIWHEKSNVDEYLQASDLFFFASKGDPNNKELNPIAIKEALEYNMPMMMHNLDVYCGKYDDFENITFLTGNIDIDTRNLLDILKPKKKKEDDEVIIISTYPDTNKRKQLTIDCINSLKPLNKKIILASHYPVSDDIQEMVDYYIYDKENIIIPHSYYTHFYRQTNKYDVQVNLTGQNNSNQSLAALMNWMNGLKLAKSLGYTKALTMAFDVIVNENDYPTIDEIFKKLNDWNVYIALLPTAKGNGVETTSMGININYFLNLVPDSRSGDEFNEHCKSVGAENFLEDYYMKLLDGKQNLWIQPNTKTILPHSGVGVSSNSEYISILPINNSSEEFMVYFFTYNAEENRIVNITITSNDLNEQHSIKTADIEGMIPFTFNGDPINITFDFIDNGISYKKITHQMNNKNINEFLKNGHYKAL